jgi:hypothetical protein
VGTGASPSSIEFIMRFPVGLGLVLLCGIGCTEGASEGTPDAAPAAASTAGAGAAIVPGGTITGTVRERIPVEPYVYLRLETAGGEVWTAVADAPVTVDAPITIYNVLPMEQFASATLERTFDVIYFGALEPTAVGAHGATAASSGAPVAADAQVGVVAPATGENARTIAETWLQADRLAGTTVAVRGVVVKYNGGVMGKNWIHLQDGSGDPSIGTHDVVATSADSAAVGDTITVTGTVRRNVDVGAGYTYLLLLEDAKVARR